MTNIGEILPFLLTKKRISQFYNGQQNQVHLQWDSIEMKDNNMQDSVVVVTLFVSIRLSNCAEMKNGDNISVLVNGALGGEPAYITIAVPVYRKEDTEKVDMNLKMMANCLDVYPGDTVDISATISHSSQSKAECDSITMVLHNGPWVSKVDLTSNGSEVLWKDNSDIRRFVQHISFARHRNHSYSCVFTWPIRARGLLVVPLIPVVKHEIPTQDIPLYGTVDKRDVYQYDPCQPPYLMGPAGGLTLPDWMLIWKRSFIHVGDKMVVCYPEDSWNDFRAPKMICYCVIERDPLAGFDLGNKVSQVITYQTEDNIFIGIEPQRQGWSMSTFRYETDGKHLQNATYLPWEETDKFNKNLVGKKCSAYTSGDWNFCYSGIFYKNKQVASWDDATDVKSATTN
ncbi:hypothetical protein D915_009823 [Fasciola hepatica]|uniref:Uncharacterized protein n=1 Tax=Fasciola hepatica TaxID=6192 RepID=A0A4E0QWQ7_FASHE|nr:hypothetical protein D915_009823 [Fasciola hepatica]